MQILDWQSLDNAGRRAALARPAATSSAEVFDAARNIIAAVRREGDVALRRLTREFDAVNLDALQVTAAEFSAARAA